MLDGIDALLALEKYGTVSEAAVRLRLTQSAVSKRISALEKELKIKLIEPDGRKVKLTSNAYLFLNKARPLVVELKNLGISNEKINISQFSLGLSDSIAGSFGPLVVSQVLKKDKSLKLDFHVHRSLMLLENITLGRYQLGLCTDYEKRKDLISIPLYNEPMVIVNCELGSKYNKNVPLITIEENSATWKAIQPLLKNKYQQQFTDTQFIFVESFMASFQMAKVGFGNSLIPLGLANELRLKKSQYRILKISRPISLVTRKSISHLNFFNDFCKELKNNIEKYFQEYD